jgi:hypothetical protein
MRREFDRPTNGTDGVRPVEDCSGVKFHVQPSTIPVRKAARRATPPNFFEETSLRLK